MPNTPSHKTLTTSSQTQRLSLLDIKTLIVNSKHEILDTVRSEHAKLNDVIASLLLKVECLESKNAELEKRCRQLEQTNSQLLSNRADGMKIEEKLASVYNECEDRKLRENNLIMSGIEEKMEGTVDERRWDDEDKLKKVLSFLNIDETSFTAVSRIGRPTNGKPRLLRVKMRSVELKKRTLVSSKKLRSSESYRHVYINPDYTKNEQEVQKKLREDLKRLRANGDDVIIFRGKIIRRSEKQDF